MMPQCRGIVWGVVLLAALAMPSCGPAKGQLYGVVTHAGKPVSGGMVLIVGADKDHPVRAPLDSEGHYAASGIPVGPVKIAVLPPPPQPKLPPLPKDIDPKIIPPPGPPALSIPQKYMDPETSGLTYDVKQTRQEYNIDLP